MTRIIIAGDSWGTNSYEKNFLYPELEGYKIAPKKTYVLYPGPGYFLQQLSNLQVLTIADHGVSNQEALEQLRKTPHKDDIVIFYQTGVLRDLSRAYMNKKIINRVEYLTINCTDYLKIAVVNIKNNKRYKMDIGNTIKSKITNGFVVYTRAR